ncbi:MAG TPA: hypothetical protein VFL61_09025 [Gaiellaceae bacterium]|nr:hypothetical protein [Gaiellaceae bacterium]
MSRAGDELLAVISARQRLPWQAFREAFDVLHARALHTGSGVDDAAGYVRTRSIRLLSELSHAEVLPYGGSTAICAAPTVLAALPLAGLPLACLCGSRSLRAAAYLREAASGFSDCVRVITRGQPFSGGYVPAAIHLEATDPELLEEVARRAEIEFVADPPAWQMLQHSGSVAEYEEQLQWNSDPDPAWPRKDFDPDALMFRSNDSRAGDRLSSFQDPLTRRQIHRLWRSGRAATIDRDWGRWLHLKDLGRSVVRFEEAGQALSVPATVPFPPLLGRALALCSGLAPARGPSPENPSLQIDVYRGVGAAAAELLAEKLGANIADARSERRNA